MINTLHQQIEVKDWPLAAAGDEQFFGYVVAMGVFGEWGVEDGMIQYVDFAYNDRYTRYRLPQHIDLKRQLHAALWSNINGIAHTGDIYGKVWIRRTEYGYDVFEP